MGDEGESMRVQLARMEGKQDRLNDKVERFQADVIDLRDRHHSLSNRVGVLEADKHIRDGERKGVTMAGRLVWAGIGLLPGGIVVALMKLFGS